MTFQPNSDISGNRVRRAGSGHAVRNGGIALGGVGGLGVILVLLFNAFTGSSLGMESLGITGDQQAQYQPAGAEETLGECLTGADANEKIECRMQGTALSLDQYWGQELPQQAGIAYELPDFLLFEGRVSTGCGTAGSEVGPFYCPPDATVYIDTSFFSELTSRYGADQGPLAELYVVAHEFGHHIQNQLGTFAQADRSKTGPYSDQVRLELQADCYAGMWVKGASETRDAQGISYLMKPSQTDIASALSAAAAVGDDHIQETFTGEVQPHNWTHGSSEQRQRWFTTGLTQGSLSSCDTSSVADENL